MTIEIPLSKRGKNAGKYVAIVDDEDEILAELRWQAHVAKKANTVYARRSATSDGRKTTEILHRVIFERMGETLVEGEEVDHVDGNGLNCQRGNLRRATRAENTANSRMKPRNKLGVKGVSRGKRGKRYRARICFQYKNIHIGYYETPELAHAAYCEKAKELFGEFWNGGDKSEKS